MIPRSGCDPEINVVSIGAKILEKLIDNGLTLDEVMSCCSSELNVSIDHIILSLDWLFAINAINYDGAEVFLNEAK